MNYERILQSQQAFFKSGATLPVPFRKEALSLLEGAVQSRRAEIEAALSRDLGKSRQEADMTEISLVLEEIRFARRWLKSWSRAKKARTPLSHWPGRQWTRPIPYGSVLILSPWNYPFQLCMSPLVSALAAGNCAVVKPSELAGTYSSGDLCPAGGSFPAGIRVGLPGRGGYRRRPYGAAV